jgi:hypothetical protein
VSRGGTKKARAEHDRERTARRRVERKAEQERAKQAAKDRPRAGKGRAALLHVSGIAAPFVAAAGLFFSGQPEVEGTVASGYWLSGLVADPNAPYWRQPGGLVLMVGVLMLSAALFLATPVMAWRVAYRDRPMLERDRTSVDNPFTLLSVVALAWVVRAVGGYGNGIGGVASTLVVLSIYVAVFSAVLALVLPVIPGSGRVGGILPDFLKIPFTERALMTDEERAEARAAAAAIRATRRAGRR